MRRFLIKKTDDCGGPPTPQKTKSDEERLATSKDHWQATLVANGVECSHVQGESESLKSALYKKFMII